jgi:pentatricopeptide repeat protein
MKMMTENGHPPGKYAYSILVDIHAKKCDFRGADSILTEAKLNNLEPTLAAYASLLAACYKVIKPVLIWIELWNRAIPLMEDVNNVNTKWLYTKGEK